MEIQQGNQRKIKIKIKFFLSKCSTFILFIVSYCVYFLSLEPCYDGEELCGNNLKWIYKKVFQLILSSEIISLLIIKILFYEISKLHLIHFIAIFVLFYLYSNNYFFYNHGMYNFILFLLILILNLFFLLIFQAIKSIIYLIKINAKIIIIYSKLLIILILILLFDYETPNFDCIGWEKGLNNTSIDNNEKYYGCKIRFPKYCQYKLLSNFLDFTKIFHINCSTNKFNSRKVIIRKSKSPYIPKFFY